MSKNRYFAASNTADGFVSYFEENFRQRAQRCYIIKGGPGTGKSRLMNEMGAAFAEAGGAVEYYYCSSDPISLDGIYISFGDESVSVFDGTAPHAEDMISPGTVDNILDLGRFWNARSLRERKAEIGHWSARKSEAYRSAYRALSAYGALTETADALIRECTDIPIIEEEAAKLAQSMPHGKMLRSPLSAIGMRGQVSFDTFRENARLSLSVSDSRGYGIAYLYFEYLARACGGCRVSPHPILRGRYCGIFSDGISVTEGDGSCVGEKVIDMSEFVRRDAYLAKKDRVERLRDLSKAALKEAETAFREAGEAHMKIEEIFISAMDFRSKEEYSRDLCSEILRRGL